MCLTLWKRLLINVLGSFKLLKEETLEDGSTRTVLKLPSVVAPTKAAVLPLKKKTGCGNSS
jgi:glycyl-tRNA synthetase (class II)